MIINHLIKNNQDATIKDYLKLIDTEERFEVLRQEIIEANAKANMVKSEIKTEPGKVKEIRSIHHEGKGFETSTTIAI